MTLKEMADFIRNNRPGINYPGGYHDSNDKSEVLQYTRHEMKEFVYITDEHILQSCASAQSYEEHLELCRPLAIADTERYRRMQKIPVAKGRTRRRFK